MESMEQMKQSLEGAFWRCLAGALAMTWVLLFGAWVYLLLG